MRHFDRPQTPSSRSFHPPYGAQGHDDGVGEHNMPPVFVHDFQDQYRSAHTPFFRGRAKTAISTAPSLVDGDAAPPMPDVTQRSIHVPTRTRYFYLLQSASRYMADYICVVAVEMAYDALRMNPRSARRQLQSHHPPRPMRRMPLL